MSPQEIRKEIHRLVDRLSEEELPTARRILEGLQAVGDPVIRALVRASEEEAPISEDERAALPETEEDVRRGRVRELDDCVAEREELRVGHRDGREVAVAAREVRVAEPVCRLPDCGCIGEP